MGCSTSKLDDEEVVRLCKDRKNFIKQAIEHRIKFASNHIAYIQSLKRVSAALNEYLEDLEPRDFLLDSSYITPPMKKIDQGNFISISPNLKKIQSRPNKSYKINYLRSGGGNSAVSVEEQLQSPEIVRVESYTMDGIFAMQSSQMNSSSFFQYYSPNEMSTTFHSPSPQHSSQWDFFWNPFSSLDYYGYPDRNGLDQNILEDDISGLRQVREEEGIPELEEETEQEENDEHDHKNKVLVEDVDDDDDDDDDNDDDDDDDDEEDGMDSGDESDQDVNGVRSCTSNTVNISKAQVSKIHQEKGVEKQENGITGKTQSFSQVSSKNQENGVEKQEKGFTGKTQSFRQVSTRNQENSIENQESVHEKRPGFTVYVKKRATNMREVIKDIKDQFNIICDVANEVSSLLAASRAHYSPSVSNELSAMQMLNPVALIRSASSRSNSARFMMNSSSNYGYGGSRDDETSSSTIDFSEESSTMFLGTHQSTLDKLYAWEKKLYEEVRAGERVRRAYEKKCTQFKNQDVKGDDPFSIDKTRTAIRDLYTQIKVSIHSVEAVSKRIEVLRDQELHPQLLDLIQGLSKMWKAMAESHQTQKRTLDDAKLLLASTNPSLKTKQYTINGGTHLLSASNLEIQLRNWRLCFDQWITSQRLYVHALADWILRCVRSSEPDVSKSPFSPRRSMGAPPVFGICIKWSRVLDNVGKVPVLDGLDFFAAGVGSLCQQMMMMREDSGDRSRNPAAGDMELAVAVEEEAFMTAEKMNEVGVKVVCAGMSVAVSSLTEFALESAAGYNDLIKQWDSARSQQDSAATSS